MSDFSANIKFLPCTHRRLITTFTGSRRFVSGEVTDDIEEHLLCMDCLEYVSEPEVRSAWSGEYIDEESTSQLDDDFEEDIAFGREEVEVWQQEKGKK